MSMAYGSLMEVFCQLEIAFRVGYVNEATLARFNEDIVDVAKMLSGLIKKNEKENTAL